MFSTLTERGAEATLDALAAGASDYVTKPANVGSVQESMESIRTQLIPKLKALCAARRPGFGTAPPTRRPGLGVGPSTSAPLAPPISRRPFPAHAAPERSRVVLPAPPQRAGHGPRGGLSVLAIASSTGGPDALTTIIPQLPADLPVPVVLVQHMPPVFTRLFAQRLDLKSKLHVHEAVDGEALVAGSVYVAPGDFHLTVERRGTTVCAVLTQTAPENFCRPAADVLFRSVAKVYGGSALALVLTGMGHDGAKGAEDLIAAGSRILIQDEATSVVWGMPGAVARAGLAERVLPLSDIAPAVIGAFQAGGSRPSARSAAASAVIANSSSGRTSWH
jgi:two-component system chemotaxis response regulator CheB